jgi:hypothetical protein
MYLPIQTLEIKYNSSEQNLTRILSYHVYKVVIMIVFFVPLLLIVSCLSSL